MELVDNGYAYFEEFKDLNEEELTNKIKERYKKWINIILKMVVNYINKAFHKSIAFISNMKRSFI